MENRIDDFARDDTRPPTETQARAYFRIHDMDENGMITRMDLFQSLNMVNTENVHYPPDILKARRRLSQPVSQPKLAPNPTPNRSSYGKVIQDLFDPSNGLANEKGEIHLRPFIEVDFEPRNLSTRWA